MPATLLGTVGIWGPASEETGLIISNLEFDYGADENLLKNKSGEDQGVSLYNEKVSVSLEGEIPASSPIAPVVADTLSLVNSVPYTHLQTASGGSNIVKNVNKQMPREGWQSFRIASVLHPFLTIA